MFKYGNLKFFFYKIFFGTFFICLSSFLIISSITNHPSDPGIGIIADRSVILNYFGYPGAISSSFIIVIFGKLSIITLLYVFYVGILFVFGLTSKQLFLKFFYVFFSTIILNQLIILHEIDIFKEGIIANFLFETLSIYFLNIKNNLLFNLIFTSISLLATILILLHSFSIKISLIGNILNNARKLIGHIFLKPLFLVSYLKINKPKPRDKKTSYKSEPTIIKNNKRQSNKNLDNNRILAKDIDNNKFIFNLPDPSYLVKSKSKNSDIKEIDNQNKINSKKLEKILSEYGVEGQVVGYKTGPIVTLYEFIPNAGIKASKVIGLSDDIARAMSSVSARISSQPGKTSLGIEIPNLKRDNVMFGDLIENHVFEDLNQSITLALGKDIAGNEVFADLEKMPHLLIAGTTGSGKSVGINTIIMSILYRFKPDECKLILIDPKMLELSIYENIPHLLTPVVTNPNKAVFALKWVVKEMENRYKLMSSINVKNINSYNEKSNTIRLSGKKIYRQVQTGIDPDTRQPIFEKREISLEKMPFIVVVIDEMADLMMVAGKEVESLVQRLAQMARASGIHLVTATQRPSVDVITGTIKANFPSRLSYKVASKFDSRTILNEMGAEQLLGSGDMLFLENGANLKRLHGGYISEKEIEKVVNFIKNQATFDQKNEIKMEESPKNESMAFSFDEAGVDQLYAKAVEIVVSQQKVSTSYIQRYLQIGYNRAARIIEKMEEDKIISEANNAGKRQVLKKN